ncbi:YM-216391 family RiPP peptide [Streptomyces sp. NPDC088254]
MPENMTAEIEEVDIEVGFIIGSTCCSLEMEEDDLDIASDEA